MIPILIGTNRTDLPIRQGVTFLALADIRLCLHHHIRQSVHFLLWHIDQMKRKPLRGFTPDPRQRRQFFN